MAFKRCPKCELNYIKEEDEMCDVCANKQGTLNSKPEIKHKGRNIFMVYQGKSYQQEIAQGYLRAPYQDAGGHDPAHWAMLENVEPGDIIFHVVSQEISAISVATSKCFSGRNAGAACRQVNCKPTPLTHKLSTRPYVQDIINTCANLPYQPFDRNGDGRQGYLFDLNDNLAEIFTRAIISKNPTLLTVIPELKDIENL